jgi:crotonobetainyl-CoA:carnitine CoA-transferase CaiB-like acyl-CoA transferase
VNALEGVVVIDFGQYLAGPFGPMVLADLGADVIKVEPVTGDGMRMAGKPFFGCQRGKRDIALNLKSERGLELALELVAGADIVHHNMTAGVADRLGIGYEACKRVNPDIVYCNTWAYGFEGPLARFGGLDPLYQASAGLEYEAGAVQTGNAPLYYRFGMCDAANAMLSVVGCLSALYRQRRTGEGQELWTSLFDGGAVFASDAMLVDGAAHPRPRMDKGLHGIDACYRLYETQDSWIQIAAVRDSEFRALCALLGTPETADDARFRESGARRANRAALEAVLEPRFRTRTSVSWTHALDDAGVPNELPVDTLGGEQVLFDSDNVELGLVAEYEHPIMGAMRQFGELIQFSETPAKVQGPPPVFGQHTREIMHGLGYDDAAIDALAEEGVIALTPEPYPWTI